MEASDGPEEDSPKKVSVVPSEEELYNYARGYISAYMGLVDKEQPDILPPFAKNAPYDVEVALLPNGCFCMLFQKSNKENIIVTDRDWNYIEGKIVSGLDHLITIYSHEGASSSDAVARGKKDALSEIRSMEGNEIAQASLHLESIVDELTNVAMSNRASLKSIASQLSKLTPIKDAARRGFPQSDMLRAVQGIKDYPASPVEIKLDIPDRELLEKLSGQLFDTSEMIRRIEAQEELIEELEERIKKGYDELVEKIDDKIDHGMALVLTASDRKIDKGFATLSENLKSEGSEGASTEELDSIREQINELRVALATATSKMPKSTLSDRMLDSLRNDVSDINGRVSELQMRIKIIEDYLVKISGALKRRG